MAEESVSFHCIVCYETFDADDRYPVVLPCSHTYICVCCAQRLDRCMECRTSLFYPAGLIDAEDTRNLATLFSQTTGTHNQGGSAGSSHRYPPGRRLPSYIQDRMDQEERERRKTMEQAKAKCRRRLPLPKNLVLLSLMEAASSSANTFGGGGAGVPGLMGASADDEGNGGDNDAQDDDVRGQQGGADGQEVALAAAEDEEEEEGRRITAGVSIATGGCGTYAVSSRAGLLVVPRKTAWCGGGGAGGGVGGPLDEDNAVVSDNMHSTVPGPPPEWSGVEQGGGGDDDNDDVGSVDGGVVGGGVGGHVHDHDFEPSSPNSVESKISVVMSGAGGMSGVPSPRPSATAKTLSPKTMLGKSLLAGLGGGGGYDGQPRYSVDADITFDKLCASPSRNATGLKLTNLREDEYPYRLSFGDRVQVVEIGPDGWAKLARGRGYVYSSATGGQGAGRAGAVGLVKVGGPTDRACLMEGMIQSVAQRYSALKHDEDELYRILGTLKKDLKAALAEGETERTYVSAEALAAERGDVPRNNAHVASTAAVAGGGGSRNSHDSSASSSGGGVMNPPERRDQVDHTTTSEDHGYDDRYNPRKPPCRMETPEELTRISSSKSGSFLSCIASGLGGLNIAGCGEEESNHIGGNNSNGSNGWGGGGGGFANDPHRGEDGVIRTASQEQHHQGAGGRMAGALASLTSSSSADGAEGTTAAASPSASSLRALLPLNSILPFVSSGEGGGASSSGGSSDHQDRRSGGGGSASSPQDRQGTNPASQSYTTGRIMRTPPSPPQVQRPRSSSVSPMNVGTRQPNDPIQYYHHGHNNHHQYPSSSNAVPSAGSSSRLDFRTGLSGHMALSRASHPHQFNGENGEGRRFMSVHSGLSRSKRPTARARQKSSPWSMKDAMRTMSSFPGAVKRTTNPYLSFVGGGGGGGATGAAAAAGGGSSSAGSGGAATTQSGGWGGGNTTTGTGVATTDAGRGGTTMTTAAMSPISPPRATRQGTTPIRTGYVSAFAAAAGGGGGAHQDNHVTGGPTSGSTSGGGGGGGGAGLEPTTIVNLPVLSPTAAASPARTTTMTTNGSKGAMLVNTTAGIATTPPSMLSFSSQAATPSSSRSAPILGGGGAGGGLMGGASGGCGSSSAGTHSTTTSSRGGTPLHSLDNIDIVYPPSK